MKPLKLIMSAFGPYSKVQEIDFSKLDGSNIFLITGPTGAGKTTIFDAISYALYGSASGSSREVDTLRSDFAKGDIETFVELDFEFRDEVYKVKRYPTQFINKKKGDGLKEEKAKAELHLPSGKVITKVKEVTDRIQDILGIDKDQFKQIVMIPQGEFKKLLLADSKERGVIFRKIFGTHDYERIQNALKEKADEMRKGVQSYYDEIGVNVKGIKPKENTQISADLNTKQYLEIIEAILSEDKEIQKETNLKLNELKKQESTLKEELVKAEQINVLINENRIVKEKLEELNKCKDEIEKDRITLEKGKRAKQVESSELLYNQKVNDKNIKEKDVIHLNEEYKNSEIRFSESRAKLDVELKNQSIRDDLNKEVLSLNEKLERLKGIDGKALIISGLEAKLNYSNESLQANNIMIKDITKLKDTLDKDIKNLLTLEKQLIEKDNEQKYIKDKIEKLMNLYKEINKLKSENNIYEEKLKKRIIIDKDYKDALDKCELLDLRYKLGQAGILAKDLEAGSACPVCGSEHHPGKAKMLNETPTEDQIKVAKEVLEEKRKLRDTFYSGLEVQINTIKIITENIKNRNIDELNEKFQFDFELNEDLQDLVMNTGKKVRVDLTRIDEDINKIRIELSKKNELDKDLEKAIFNIEELNKKIIETTEYKLDLVSKIASEKEALSSVMKEIDEEFRDKEKLSKHIEIKTLQFKESQSKFENAQKVEANEAKINSAIKAKLSLANEDLSKLINESVALKEALDNSVKENKFNSIEEYIECKVDSNELNKIELKVNEFDSNMKVLTLKNKDLDEKCLGLKFMETEEVKIKINEVLNIISEVEKELNIIFARVDNNKHRYNQIKSIYEKIKVLEEKYSIVGQLANYSNGRTSPYITFESYVLAVYFKQIIDAANIRLTKMTAGRFLLKRKEDKGKGAGQKGLDLEVFDNYTGKLRGVSTLSGGESFKASLSLALGLSDIIQMNAGGIKLDTMFIDEGFGTLDPESLDNAVSCLLELQQGGRLVGVISHVPELKERIERKLNIVTTAEGSVASFNN